MQPGGRPLCFAVISWLALGSAALWSALLSPLCFAQLRWALTYQGDNPQTLEMIFEELREQAQGLLTDLWSEASSFRQGLKNRLKRLTGGFPLLVTESRIQPLGLTHFFHTGPQFLP